MLKIETKSYWEKKKLKEMKILEREEKELARKARAIEKERERRIRNIEKGIKVAIKIGKGFK